MSGLNFNETRREKIRWIREEFEKSLCKGKINLKSRKIL